MDAFINWFDSQYANIDEFFDNVIAFIKTLLDFLGEWPIKID